MLRKFFGKKDKGSQIQEQPDQTIEGNITIHHHESRSTVHENHLEDANSDVENTHSKARSKSVEITITSEQSDLLRQKGQSLGLPENLPDEMLQLALINDAFRKGVLALQHMNLDKDLYWKAMEDLRAKYDRVRDPHIKKLQDRQREQASEAD